MTDYRAILKDRQEHGLDLLETAAKWLEAQDRIIQAYKNEFDKMFPKRKAR